MVPKNIVHVHAFISHLLTPSPHFFMVAEPQPSGTAILVGEPGKEDAFRDVRMTTCTHGHSDPEHRANDVNLWHQRTLVNLSALDTTPSVMANPRSDVNVSKSLRSIARGYFPRESAALAPGRRRESARHGSQENLVNGGDTHRRVRLRFRDIRKENQSPMESSTTCRLWPDVLQWH